MDIDNVSDLHHLMREAFRSESKVGDLLPVILLS